MAETTITTQDNFRRWKSSNSSAKYTGKTRRLKVENGDKLPIRLTLRIPQRSRSWWYQIPLGQLQSLNWGLVHRLFMSSQSLDPLPNLYSCVNVTLLRQVCLRPLFFRSAKYRNSRLKYTAAHRCTKSKMRKGRWSRIYRPTGWHMASFLGIFSH